MTDYKVRFWAIVGVAIVVALVFAIGGWYVVPPGHRGVKVTLGSVSEEPMSEGFGIKWPFVQKVVPMSVQQETQGGTAACFSSDLQTVSISFNVLYKVNPNRAVELFQLYRGPVYQSLIEPRVQEAIKQVSAGFPAEKLVKTREAIKTMTLEKLRAEVGDVASIVDVTISNIDLTDELENAIELKMVQEQQSFAKQFELDKSRKDAEIVIVRAQAEAEAVRITGEALRSAPEMIQLEIVKKWNGVSPRTVVVGNDGASVLLPLTEGEEVAR